MCIALTGHQSVVFGTRDHEVIYHRGFYSSLRVDDVLRWLNADILVDVSRDWGVNSVAFVCAVQLLLGASAWHRRVWESSDSQVGMKETACTAFPHATGYYNAFIYFLCLMLDLSHFNCAVSRDFLLLFPLQRSVWEHFCNDHCYTKTQNQRVCKADENHRVHTSVFQNDRGGSLPRWRFTYLSVMHIKQLKPGLRPMKINLIATCCA